MPKQYTAFISYRHCPLDTAVAEALHKRIERYRIPKDLRKNGQKHMGVVFRDRDELPLSNNLTQDIYEALDNARFLIVVCTPDTPKSMWVDREIQHFIEKHGHDRVLTVLAAGTPEESIPKRITQIYGSDGTTVSAEIEPLCAFLVDKNERKVLRNLNSEFLRLAAAILDCPYDALKQRQKRYRARRLIAGCTAAAAVVLTIMGLLIRWNLDVTRKNEEISRMNEEIQKQYRQSQLNESHALALLSESLLEQGDRMGALESAYDALNGDRPYYPAAEGALVQALNVYGDDGLYPYATVKQNAQVQTVAVSRNGGYAMLYDSSAGVSCVDLETQKALWSDPSLPNFLECSVITRDDQRFLGVYEDRAVVLELLTGKVLQTILFDEKKDTRELWAVSGDDALLVVDNKTVDFPTRDKPEYTTELVFYDISAGKEQTRFYTEDMLEEPVFSHDSSTLLLLGVTFEGTHFYDRDWAVWIDCETGKAAKVQLPGHCQSSCALPDGDFLLLCHRKTEDGSITPTYYRYSKEGILRETLPMTDETGMEVRQMLSDGTWLFCLDYNNLQIRYLKDGKLLELVELPESMHFENATFLDERNRLVVSCRESNAKNDHIYCFYPTAEFHLGTDIDRWERIYTDSQGNPLRVQWNQKTLYTDGLDMYDYFLPAGGGQTAAFVWKEDYSQVFFLRMHASAGDTAPSADALEKLDMLRNLSKEPLLPNARYDRYDREENRLYYEDGQGQQKSTLCPDTFAGPVSKVDTGGSGLIVARDHYRNPSGFGIYSIRQDGWKWLPFPENRQNCQELQIGAANPWVAMLFDENYLQVFDAATDQMIYEGVLPVGEVRGMGFICQDKYLLLDDNVSDRIVILDTSSWMTVTQYAIPKYLSVPKMEQITAAYSQDGSKLYIGELTGDAYGMVFDTETWTQVAKIPNMLLYDDARNVAVCKDPDTGELYQRNIYSLEELLNMAQARLYG